MKLTTEQLHGVREWLRQSTAKQSFACPFNGGGKDPEVGDGCIVLCPAIFKRLDRKRKALEHGVKPGNFSDLFYSGFCPCDFYAHTYVVRKARLLLGRKGETK